jgi:hypothetical protein
MRVPFFQIMMACLILTMAGCAARTGSPVAPAADAAGDSGGAFARLVGEAPAGVPLDVPSTPYGGPATVIPGDSYVSGLGQGCRSVVIMEAGRQFRAGVCRGEEGWIPLPLIFEPMPR